MTEFIDREKPRRRRRKSGSSMGELPENTSFRRGDLRTYSGVPSSPNPEGISDVLYQNNQMAIPSAPGTLPYQANVVATFDSRFINGQDFVNTNFETWNITANPPAALILRSEFNVPAGYNVVVRAYRYEMDPPVPIDIDALFLDFQVDNVAVLNMTSITQGQITDDWVDCFFIASAGSTITTQFRAPTGIASATTDTRKILIQLRGNLLQDTGAPLPLEVANTEKAGYSKFKGE